MRDASSPPTFLVLLAVLSAATLACRRAERPVVDAAMPPGVEDASHPDAAGGHPSGVVRLSDVLNLDRYPGLQADHLARLERDGFFLAPTTAEAAFLLYQRNERVGLPSYVTPEMAVDLLLAAWGAVAQEIEANHAAPALYRALHALVVRGLEMRRWSLRDGTTALAGLDRAITLLAIAGHLLGAAGARPAEMEPELPADPDEDIHAEGGAVELVVPLPELPWPALPPHCDEMLRETLVRIDAAEGVTWLELLRRDVDFGRFRRLEAAPMGRARALRRALLWLELAAPAAAGDLADPASGPVIVRLLADAAAGDEPAAALWDRAVRLLRFVGRERQGLDPMPVATALRAAVEGGRLPRSAGGAVTAVLALPAAPPRGTLGLLPGSLDPARCPACDDTTLWLGPAQLVPSVAARLEVFPEPHAVPRGRARVRPEAWAAIPRAWAAERRLALSRAPLLPNPGALADCVPAGIENPHGAVAPVPEAFRSVAEAAETLAQELRSLGILTDRELETPFDPQQASVYRLQELLRSVVTFSRAFAEIASLEVAGTPWNETQVLTVTRAGGWAESILADALQADAVAPVDGRRAVRRGEVVDGLGGVDALYVVIDTPRGPVLARGAMRAVYENLQWPFPMDTFGDEAWRTWLEAAPPPPRPPWLALQVAAPVPPPPVVGEGNRRCLGPDTGGDLEI